MQNGDVIIADTAEDDVVGKATEITNIQGLVVSGLHTMACRPRTEFSSCFLGYYLNSACYHNQLYPFMQGVKVTSISKGNIALTEIRFPTKVEQKKIASMIALIDERIDKQRLLIENLKLYKRGVVKQIFNTIPNRFVPLKSLCTIYGGYAFDSKTYDSNGIYKIVTISSVTGDRFADICNCNSMVTIPSDIQKHQKLKINDIVVSMTGNVGRTSLIKNSNCLLNQRVAKVSPNKPNFLELVYQILSMPSFENEMINRSQGAAQKNIKATDIENFNVPWFDSEEIVEHISNVLLNMDMLIISNERFYKSTLLLKQSLLQQMFI